MAAQNQIAFLSTFSRFACVASLLLALLCTACAPATSTSSSPVSAEPSIKPGDLVVMIVRYPSPSDEPNLGLQTTASRVDAQGMIYVRQLPAQFHAAGLTTAALAQSLLPPITKLSRVGAPAIHIHLFPLATVDAAGHPEQWPLPTSPANLNRRYTNALLSGDETRLAGCFDQSTDFRRLGALMNVNILKLATANQQLRDALSKRFGPNQDVVIDVAIPNPNEDRRGVLAWNVSTQPDNPTAPFTHSIAGIPCQGTYLKIGAQWLLAIDPPAQANASQRLAFTVELRELVDANNSQIAWIRECISAVPSLTSLREAGPTFSRLRERLAQRN